MIIYGLERVLDEMREQAILEGEIRGELKGELKGKYEVARNMLAKGMSLELVIELTGLTEQDLESLLKQTH